MRTFLIPIHRLTCKPVSTPPRERHHPHPGITHERFTELGAVTRDDTQPAWRQSCLHKILCQHQRRQWSEGAGLEDDRITCRDGGANVMSCHRKWIVERRDASNDADRKTEVVPDSVF